jgi:trehalose-phosphatase
VTPHLFSAWPSVSRRVRSADSLRLFLDFDGTLAPLCESPEHVALGADMRRALGRLVEHGSVRATIVSGRRRTDLVEHVRLPRVEYWGMYGWERRAGRALPREARALISDARGAIGAQLDDLPGLWFEDKGHSFSIHFRGASAASVRRARGRLTRALRGYGGRLWVATGKKAWDVLPREIRGKGDEIIQAISRQRRPFLPVYVGDDATDESAFAALGGGITVRVGGTERTRARYRLASPDQVRGFLERLEGALTC